MRRHYDADESHSVDVLRCADRPAEGLATYSTLTLHATPNLLEGADLRVELMGVAPAAATDFPNLLATAAFFVIKDGWLAAPGVVFPSLLAQYELSDTLEHLMWTEPFVYDELSTVDLGDGDAVHWLLGIPIGEGERRLLLAEGYDALEQRFAAAEVEYWDLARAPLADA